MNTKELIKILGIALIIYILYQGFILTNSIRILFSTEKFSSSVLKPKPKKN